MGKRIALLIGTTRYDDRQFAQLSAPNADIEGLARVLRDPGVCAFDRVEVLLDQVFADVQLAVSRFFSEGARDDLLLLYFSGHGIVDAAGRLYLCLKNSHKALIRATALRAASLSDEIDMCRCERQVLILDCCHAGAFVRGAKGATGIGESVGTMGAFEGTGRGRVVLTATDATQFAFEGERIIGETANASLFTHYLIEGLTSGAADSDGSGQISVDEAFTYAYHRVTQVAPHQTPGKWAYKQQGDIILAKNPRPVALKNLIESGLLEATAAGKPLVVREASVRDLARYLSDSRPGVVLAAREALMALADDDSRTIADLARSALQSSGMRDLGSLPPATLKTAPRSRGAEARPAVASNPPVVPAVRSAPLKRVAVALTGVAAVALGLSLVLPQRRGSPSAPAIPIASAAGSAALAMSHSAAASAPPTASFAHPAVSANQGPASAAQLRVERGDDVPGARVYLVQQNSPGEELLSFPTTVPVDAASTVSLEAYWGKKRLIQQVRFQPNDQERVVRIDRNSDWRSDVPVPPPPPTSPPSQPDPPPQVFVAGRLRSGHLEGAELEAGLRQLKSSLARCATSGASGKASFIAGVETDGSVGTFIPVSSELTEEVATCFVAQSKNARFPGTRSKATIVDVVVTVR